MVTVTRGWWKKHHLTSLNLSVPWMLTGRMGMPVRIAISAAPCKAGCILPLRLRPPAGRQPRGGLTDGLKLPQEAGRPLEMFDLPGRPALGDGSL